MIVIGRQRTKVKCNSIHISCRGSPMEGPAVGICTIRTTGSMPDIIPVSICKSAGAQSVDIGKSTDSSKCGICQCEANKSEFLHSRLLNPYITGVHLPGHVGCCSQVKVDNCRTGIGSSGMAAITTGFTGRTGVASNIRAITGTRGYSSIDKEKDYEQDGCKNKYALFHDKMDLKSFLKVR